MPWGVKNKNKTLAKGDARMQNLWTYNRVKSPAKLNAVNHELISFLFQTQNQYFRPVQILSHFEITTKLQSNKMNQMLSFNAK